MSLICIKVKKKKKKEEERCLSFGRGIFKFFETRHAEEKNKERTKKNKKEREDRTAEREFFWLRDCHLSFFSCRHLTSDVDSHKKKKSDDGRTTTTTRR